MDLNCLSFQFPCLPKIHCLFQGRSSLEHDPSGLAGNISFQAGADADRTAATRRLLLDCAKSSGLETWAECRQVHGTEILIEPVETALGARPEELPAADGMMSAKAGLGLMIKTADCQPLLFAHRSGQCVMAIHSGWRGSRAGFPFLAVRSFCGHYNIKPEDVFAVRGPSLGPSRAEFVNFEAEWGREFEPWHCEATRCVDLWALTRHQLRRAGLPDSQIYGLDICTYLNARRFFSHRRKSAGRQASLVWIERGQRAA